MSGVVLILGFPLLAALLVYLLRRWPLPSSGVAGMSALLLATLLWRWPNDKPVVFLGRLIHVNEPVVLLGQTFAMQPTAQWVIGFLAVALAATHLSAWRVSQGRSFFPFSLVMLSLFSAVLTIQPVWRSPVLLAVTMAIAAFVVQAGRRGSTRGATRALWLPVLAAPLFLLAAWFASQAPLDPENTRSLEVAAQVASLGLILLLAPWPLHGPAVSLGEDAPPLVAAWLLTALAVVGVTLLRTLLVQYEWLQGATLFYTLPTLRLGELLVLGGLATCLWAGLAAAVQEDLARLWSYAALFTYGAVLISLGLGARGSWSLVWLLLIARTVGLIVAGYGLAVIRQRAGSRTDLESVQGLATRLPVTSTAFLLGILSLAGLPLTAGFSGQWALMQALGSRDWLQAVVVLAGALGLIVGVIRSLRSLLGPLSNLLLERETRFLSTLAFFGLGLLLVTGLRPEVWLKLLSAAVNTFLSAPG